jgi:flagellar basal body-associated protein FliL
MASGSGDPAYTPPMRTDRLEQGDRMPKGERSTSNLIWIIIVVLVVLFVLGYFGRGRFGR